MPQRYQIQFPPESSQDLGQDEAFFFLVEEGDSKQVRLHDYDKIYSRPGLYEQLFYDRLRCNSPNKVAELLERSLESEWQNGSEMRVLDLGAGNGMMAERLRKLGVARIVGVDIIPEAKEASFRDRPTAYDEYYVQDFTSLDDTMRDELTDWNFDCLTSVAALGFGDIPPRAFFEAIRLIPEKGWVAFNIKETFLNHTDHTGFSRFVRELIFSEYLDIHQLERYTHRLSMEGVALPYYALVARVTSTIPADFLTQIEVE